MPLQEQDRPGFVPVKDYLRLPHNPDTWVIKDLLPLSGAALIYGAPKLGKTSMVIQLAAALTGGADEWLGFPIITHGKVLMLELDTPRSTFRLRFDALQKAGVKFNPDNLLLADRECLNYFPFDISKQLPYDHMGYLHSLIQPLKPVAVIIDTLRKIHSLDENSSTDMSNVISRLIGAAHPAALIIISHSVKPSMNGVTDVLAEHRGSGAVTAEMDCVLKLTRSKLNFAGRNIEEGSIKLERQDTDGILLWAEKKDDDQNSINQVMADNTSKSLRAKAKKLGPMIGKTEEASMSILRRALAKSNLPTDNKENYVNMQGLSTAI